MGMSSTILKLADSVAPVLIIPGVSRGAWSVTVRKTVDGLTRLSQRHGWRFRIAASSIAEGGVRFWLPDPEVSIRPFAGVAVAVAVGLVALVAPISTSVYLARRESLSVERGQSLSYARDVMRRSLETRDEFARTLRELNQDGFPPCSPQEIDIMRRLDIASSYIQAVGRLEGNQLICTSLGTTQHLDVGPPSLVAQAGVAERFGVRIPIAPDYPLTVVSRDGIAIVIDPYLLVDTPTEGPDISIGLFVPSQPGKGLIAAYGKALPVAWLRPIEKGGEVTVIEGGSIVSRVRAADSDLESIVAVPELYADRHVREFALVFVPLGLLCGAGLVWAVIYLSRQRLSMKTVLRAAARRREFYVEYQPIVELTTKRWVGAEALVRWRRDGRIIDADLFIPFAEESGTITLITSCVAAIVAADLPKLIEIDPGFKVAINLSLADLRSPQTLDLLRHTVRSAGAQFSNLEAETTERSFLQSPEAGRLIDQIRELGIRVSMDDFGTGYSSLACLQGLRLDTLKIDKVFVETVGTDGVTSQVVPHIIDMAHSLGLEMVAEGVETEAQAVFLESRGVHYGQGWYFANPMGISALRQALYKRAADRQASSSRG